MYVVFGPLRSVLSSRNSSQVGGAHAVWAGRVRAGAGADSWGRWLAETLLADAVLAEELGFDFCG